MRKTDIEKIIKGGSVKQKIKLYMTDIALCNVDIDNIGKLLSDKERDELWRSIKDPKDIKYYNSLRDANSSFIYFKDKLTIENYKLKATHGVLTSAISTFIANFKNAEIINDLLEIYPDKKSREIALKTAIDRTKSWGGKMYQEKGYPGYIEIDLSNYFEQVKEYVKLVNTLSKQAKEIITLFKKILSTDLPLQPYKDWLKEEEDTLKKTIETSHKMTSVITSYPAHYPKIIPYEEIEVVVTEEDLQNFKGADL